MKKEPNKTYREFRKLPALLIVICMSIGIIGVVILLRSDPTASEASKRPTTGTLYKADTGGTITLSTLGLKTTIEPELAQQGLLGIEKIDQQSDSKTITFTTQALADKNEACDGIHGRIGTMTRYEGPAANMSQHMHVHGSTTFDFPGFHIVYLTPDASCVTSTPGYDPHELTKETVASKQLWDAMRSAKAL